MAFSFDAFVPAGIGSAGVKIVNADGTALKTLFTAGAQGGLVDAVGVSNDDTAAGDAQLWITIGGVDFLIGTKTVPITAGFVTGTPAFNFFDGIQSPWIPINRDGQRHIKMPPAGILKVGMKVAVTAAKSWYFFADAVQY